MRTDDRQKISAHFAETAGPYRDFWAPVLLEFAAPLLDRIPAPATGAPVKGLDLGCGIGAVTRSILDRFGDRCRMTGADLVMEMLAEGRRHLTGVDLVRVDAPRLPFRDGPFDFVISTFLLQHVREQRRTLSEVFRILKPGGVFLSTTWGRNDGGCGAFDVWEETLMEFGAKPDDPDPPRRFDESIDTETSMRSLLESTGFDVTFLVAVTPSYAWTPGSIEGVRIHLGAPGRRFRALPEARRNAFLREARRRLRTVEPSDFIWEPEVILAAGVRRK